MQRHCKVKSIHQAILIDLYIVIGAIGYIKAVRRMLFMIKDILMGAGAAAAAVSVVVVEFTLNI